LRLIATAFVFALLCTAPLASAQKAIDITPDSIAGIHLGMSKAQARALLRGPVRHDILEDGYERYVSPRQKVEVYFRKGTKGAAVVTTWSKVLETDGQIGPCSTVTALKKAYGGRLVPFRQNGKLYAYRLGNLVFAMNGKPGRITSVGLGRGPQATYVTLNVTPCT
jgi:hypothetical protein